MAHVHSSGRVLMFRVMNSQVEKVELAGRYVFNVKFTLDVKYFSGTLFCDRWLSVRKREKFMFTDKKGGRFDNTLLDNFYLKRISFFY